jgi:hypothetical protein
MGVMVLKMAMIWALLISKWSHQALRKRGTGARKMNSRKRKREMSAMGAQMGIGKTVQSLIGRAPRSLK